MLSSPATIALSNRTLNHLAERIRQIRRQVKRPEGSSVKHSLGEFRWDEQALPQCPDGGHGA